MKFRIGHAVCNEKGKATGGKPGDKTGKEVCISEWYSDSWIVLRPIDPSLAENSAVQCENACANANIGYDQNRRNTLHTEAKKVKYDLKCIKTPCDTDCSEFMTICSIAGGNKALEHTGNGPTTRTMEKIFLNTNKYTKLSGATFTKNTDHIKRGDIFVKAGDHTIMALDNGANVNTKKSVPADYIDSSLKGSFKTTGKLNMRRGAGTENLVITVIPKGTKVTCEGYYSLNSQNSKWLYVTVTINKVKYAGFCSYAYLQKC